MDRQLDSLVAADYGREATILHCGEYERLDDESEKNKEIRQKKEILKFKTENTYDDKEYQKNQNDIEKLEKRYKKNSKSYSYYRPTTIQKDDTTKIYAYQRMDDKMKSSTLVYKTKNTKTAIKPNNQTDENDNILQ